MSRSPRTLLLAAAVTVVALASIAVVTSSGRDAIWGLWTRMRGRVTVEDRLAAFDDSVHDEVQRWCDDAGLPFPPSELALVVFKQERVLHLHGRADGPWRRLATLPILGASGGAGPKLRRGDGQVPEGVYPIESLNPNSRHHLALRVGYPNQHDRDRADADGRTELGGDIMIHGGSSSIGCIAIGDPGIERLFLLAARTGPHAMRVVIAPCDLRRAASPSMDGAPEWVEELHATLRNELHALCDGPLTP